jgi:hypothetical protein
MAALGQKQTFSDGTFTDRVGMSALLQQSIAPIGECTNSWALAHSHHILPLALSVLPYPAGER